MTEKKSVFFRRKYRPKQEKNSMEKDEKSIYKDKK